MDTLFLSQQLHTAVVPLKETKGCSPHGLDRHRLEDMNPVHGGHSEATVETQTHRAQSEVNNMSM